MPNKSNAGRYWNARLIAGNYTRIDSTELSELAWRLCAFLLENFSDRELEFKSDKKISEWERAKRREQFKKYLVLGCILASGKVYGVSSILKEHVRDLNTVEARKADLFWRMTNEAWHEVVSTQHGLIADSDDSQRLCDNLLKSLDLILYQPHRKMQTILSIKHRSTKITAELPTGSSTFLNQPRVPSQLLNSITAEAENSFLRGLYEDPASHAKKLMEFGRILGRMLTEDNFSYLAQNDGQEIIVDASHISVPTEIARVSHRFLASRHLIARCLDIPETKEEPVEEPWPPENSRIAFICDPSRTLRFDLVERMVFEDILPEFTKGLIPIDIYDDVDGRGFLELLNSGTYAVLHFTGHGGISANGTPFLLLTRNERVSADDVFSSKNPPGCPDLIVLNACLSAAGDVYSMGKYNTKLKIPAYETFRRGFASAFLASGSRAFIGTIWPVADRCAAKFAEEFYRYLFATQIDVDESLWRVKRCLLGQQDFIDTLAYILFKHSPDDRLLYLTKGWKALGPPEL